jgi:hypothetical protein
MLAAGAGTVVANVSTGRSWDDHLIANILILGVFHAVVKGVMDRVPGREVPERQGAIDEESPAERPPRPQTEGGEPGPVNDAMNRNPGNPDAALDEVIRTRTEPRQEALRRARIRIRPEDILQALRSAERRGQSIDDVIDRRWNNDRFLDQVREELTRLRDLATEGLDYIRRFLEETGPRPGADVGDGSDAAAIRNEARTGEATRGRYHAGEAQDWINGLRSRLAGLRNAARVLGDLADQINEAIRNAEQRVRELEDALRDWGRRAQDHPGVWNPDGTLRRMVPPPVPLPDRDNRSQQ